MTRLAVLATIVALAAPAWGAESIATLTVEAGERIRIDTPLVFPVADLFEDGAPLWLEETTAGRNGSREAS